MDAEELSEEHDELDSLLQEGDTAAARARSRAEVEDIAAQFINAHIMVLAIKEQLDEFTDK